MDISTDIKDLKREVKELKSLVRQLVQKETKQPELWVTAYKLKEMTGWPWFRTKQYREEGKVVFRKMSTGGYEYNFHSIDKSLLLKSVA